MAAKNEREYRAMTLRALDPEPEAQEQKKIVRGYATTFDEEYTLYKYDGFELRESVDPHAFDECDMSDVIMQYDHQGRVFARNKNKTLSLQTDEHGLLIEADLGGTDIGRQLYDEIRGGYTDKMSFGFIVSGNTRTYETIDENGQHLEICHRRITKISKLFDVSAVSLPANDMTSISARQLADGVIREVEAERLRRANIRRAKARLELMEV